MNVLRCCVLCVGKVASGRSTPHLISREPSTPTHAPQLRYKFPLSLQQMHFPERERDDAIQKVLSGTD